MLSCYSYARMNIAIPFHPYCIPQEDVMAVQLLVPQDVLEKLQNLLPVQTLAVNLRKSLPDGGVHDFPAELEHAGMFSAADVYRRQIAETLAEQQHAQAVREAGYENFVPLSTDDCTDWRFALPESISLHDWEPERLTQMSDLLILLERLRSLGFFKKIEVWHQTGDRASSSVLIVGIRHEGALLPHGETDTYPIAQWAPDGEPASLKRLLSPHVAKWYPPLGVLFAGLLCLLFTTLNLFSASDIAEWYMARGWFFVPGFLVAGVGSWWLQDGLSSACYDCFSGKLVPRGTHSRWVSARIYNVVEKLQYALMTAMVVAVIGFVATILAVAIIAPQH